jgi:hypothetical protein
MVDHHLLADLKALWCKRLVDSKMAIECDPCCEYNWDDNFESLRALWKIEELKHHLVEYHSADKPVPHVHTPSVHTGNPVRHPG